MTTRRPVTRALALVAALTLAAVAIGVGALGGTLRAGAGNGTFNDAFESFPITVNGTYEPIVGEFDCDDLGLEIIWYAPGPTPDYLWDVTGTIGDQVQYTSEPLTINGDYEPFVIPFDDTGGCRTDIFWYAPGPDPDYIWDVDTPGDVGYTSHRTSVNGTYTPVVTQMGSGIGIYWYAPGTATDSIWLLDLDGGITVGSGPQVSGTYRPAATSAGMNLGILWYARGTAQDHFWGGLDINQGSPGLDLPATINGYYEPHSLAGDVLLYGPGGAPDYLITSISSTTGEVTTLPGSVSGTYRVGNLGNDAIVWHAPGGARDYLWLRP